MMNKPVAITQLKAQGTQKGEKVPLQPFRISDIPGAMDKMGWTVAAQIMRRWFSVQPAYKMPSEIRTGTDLRTGEPVDYRTLPASQLDDQIVKMAWALKFKPANEALNELYNNWCTDKGRNRIKILLEDAGWQSGLTKKLGYSQNGSIITSAKELEMVCQMNFKAFGGLSDTLDDFFGAINKATMKVAVVGEASYSYEKKCDVFKVERLGFYIRDTYDFNEDGEGLKAWLNDLAGLGVWSKDRTLSKADTAIYRVNYDAVKNKIGTIPMRVAAALLLAARYPGFVPVDNGDFRKYQDKINKGGDYFVFSDVYWVRSNVAEFIIPA